MSATRENNMSGLIRVHVRDGMSQARRKLPALEKDYFNIDEKTFEQLLSQIQDYTTLLKFHGVELEQHDAVPLAFAKNEIMVMVNILTMDLTKLERQFQAQLRIKGDNQKISTAICTREMMANSAEITPQYLMSRFESWLTLLNQPQSEAGEQLYRLLESVVAGFTKELYVNYESDVGVETADAESFNAFLLKALEMVQVGVRTLLPASMKSENHDPAIALRIVFVKLYQKIQQKLNRFTLNLFDFYFSDVLQVKPRQLIPDSVYLILQPSVKAQDIFLQQGTEFVAGIDKNSQDIIYKLDKEQIINDAQVVRLHSLYFPREDVEGSPSLVGGCLLNTITAMPTADKKLRDEMTACPIFGAMRSELDTTTAINGRLGFAIAHKVLMLAEGKRQIDITIQFSAKQGSAWSTLKKILQELPVNKRSRSDMNAKFFTYFGAMFELKVTTEMGWFTIDEYKPAFNGSDKTIKLNSLRLSFNLPESAPAITAYDASIHGEKYDSSTPVLQVLLRENYVQYPYDIIRQLVIREIAIDVKVEGVRNLIVHNNLGQLSALSPFAPFGPMPDVGSYFIVGSEEICNKQITQVDFDIEWGGLPNASGGFTTWYKGYGHINNSKSFVTSVSVMSDSQWQPSNPSSSQFQELFSSKIQNGHEFLIASKTLSGNTAIPYYKAQDSARNQKTFRYSTFTKSGLFKFTLQGPIGGFGHREYTTLLTNTLTNNARLKIEKLLKPLPNAPYTPEITSIRLNYSASAIVNLNDVHQHVDPLLRDQFIHLHPLGWESVTPLRHPRIHLVPQYDNDGALLIGLNASECRQLSLFFHLKNNSLPIQAARVTETLDVPVSVGAENSDSESELKATDDIQSAEPKVIYSIEPATQIQWEYLSQNQWRRISEKNIVSDTTNSFLVSGIVQLIIPPDITNDNTILPQDLFWLKVSANKQLSHFSEIYSVYAQAVKATWLEGEHPQGEQPMILAPESITRTRQNIPGIASVMQICSSFGGESAESMPHLRTRMSERLRHKNRALTPLDYEMLILNEFPQIYKVKCFANVRTDKVGQICPGHLLIIPIPHINAMGDQHYKPHFDGYLIERINQFIKALSPACVKISVENPVYEEIQVRCAVHFKEGLHRGYHQNMLNQALCDYLSPWGKTESGIGNRVHFGWSISEQDIKSFIYNLDYIAHVTDFSLLRIAPREQGLYTLDDTAAPQQEGIVHGRIQPSFWWSTAVPLEQHYILSIDESVQINAQITGYDELAVGSTFIIA